MAGKAGGGGGEQFSPWDFLLSATGRSCAAQTLWCPQSGGCYLARANGNLHVLPSVHLSVCLSICIQITHLCPVFDCASFPLRPTRCKVEGGRRSCPPVTCRLASHQYRFLCSVSLWRSGGDGNIREKRCSGFSENPCTTFQEGIV